MPRHSQKEIAHKLQRIKVLLHQHLSDDVICEELQISKQCYLRWMRQYRFEYELHRLLPENFEGNDIQQLLQQTHLSSEDLKEIFGLLNHSFFQQNAPCFEFPHLNVQQKYFISHYLQKTLHISERKACQLIGQCRQTQQRMTEQIQRQLEKSANEQKIILEMHAILSQPSEKFWNPTDNYGYRRMTKLLKERGFACSESVVYRLWQSEGLSKRPYLIDQKFRPTQPNELCYIDRIIRKAQNGSQIVILILWDEWSNRCVDIQVQNLFRHHFVKNIFCPSEMSLQVPSNISLYKYIGTSFGCSSWSRDVFKNQYPQDKVFIPNYPSQYFENFKTCFLEFLDLIEDFTSIFEAIVVLQLPNSENLPTQASFKLQQNPSKQSMDWKRMQFLDFFKSS